MNIYTERFAQELSGEGYVTVAADYTTGPLEPVYDYLVSIHKRHPWRSWIRCAENVVSRLLHLSMT